MQNTASDIYGQIVVKRQLAIEIQITATGTGVDFPLQVTQNQHLNKPNVLVYGVESMTTSEQAVSESNRPLIAPADLPYLILCLVTLGEGKEFAQNYPMTRLRPATYNGYTQYFTPRPISLDLSKVVMLGAGTMTTSMSILLNFYYKLQGE